MVLLSSSHRLVRLLKRVGLFSHSRSDIESRTPRVDSSHWIDSRFLLILILEAFPGLGGHLRSQPLTPLQPTVDQSAVRSPGKDGFQPPDAIPTGPSVVLTAPSSPDRDGSLLLTAAPIRDQEAAPPQAAAPTHEKESPRPQAETKKSSKYPADDPFGEIKTALEAYQWDEAERLGRAKLAQVEESPNPDRVMLGSTLRLLVAAKARGWTVADAETVAFAERALKIEEESHGPDDPALAGSLATLGRVLLLRADYGRAKAMLERALSIRERALGADHLKVGEIHSTLAQIDIDTGDYAGAKKELERTIEIYTKALGPEDARIGIMVGNLGEVLLNLGEYAAAQSLYERALAIRQCEKGSEEATCAVMINGLANIAYNQGDYVEAKRLYQRAIDLAEKGYGPDHPSLAKILEGLGNVLHARGELDGALRIYTRVLSILEKQLGPNHTDLGLTLGSLASVLHDMGDYAGARRHDDRALHILESSLGPEHPDVGRVSANLAGLYRDMGDLASARSYQERAVGVLEKALGSDHPDLVTALDELARILDESGERRDALAMYERSLKLAKAKLGPDHPSTAHILVNLARLQESTEPSVASATAKRAKEIYEKAFDPEHFLVASALDIVGRIEWHSGDFASARRDLVQALEIREHTFGPDHPIVASSLNNLARLEWSTGSRDAAFEKSLRAEAIVRRSFRRTTRSLSERESFELESVRESGLDLASTIAAFEKGATQKREAQSLWDAQVRSRALVLDEMAERHRFAAAAATEQIATHLTELDAARYRLAHVQVAGPEAEHPRAYRAKISEAQAKVEQAERDLAEESEVFRGESQRSDGGLAEAVGGLPAGAALLAYVQYEKMSASPARKPGNEGGQAAGSESVPSYLALLTSGAERPPTLISLGAVTEIDALVDRWRREVSSPPEDLQGETTYRRAGTDLRRAIWDPVAPYLSRSQTIFVVLEGRLNLVNFGTLPTGPNRYLVETGPRLQYLSSERDLVRERREARPSSGILVVGGADFDASPAALPAARTALDSQAPITEAEAARTAGGAKADPADGTAVARTAGDSEAARTQGNTEVVGAAGAARHPSPEIRVEDVRASGRVEGDGSGRALSSRLTSGEGYPPKVDDPSDTGSQSPPLAAEASPSVYRGPTSRCGSFRSMRFPSLPSSLAEANEVEALWSAKGGDAAAKVSKLTGTQASEGAFKRAAPGRGIVHLATHGFFLEDQCESALHSFTESGRGATRKDTAENPLLLTGLVLAGANKRNELSAEGGIEDGILTADEIASLDLSSADWVVLSACESGVGPIRTGEGVLGLRRAFEVAGARTLIMSLWPVADHDAREWIRGLYEGRLSGQSTAEAVRRASLRMIEARRRLHVTTHPFFWGAFVAAGNPS